jgi:hypothetical protein
MEHPFWAVFGLFLYTPRKYMYLRASQKNVQGSIFKNVGLRADQSSGFNFVKGNVGNFGTRTFQSAAKN